MVLTPDYSPKLVSNSIVPLMGMHSPAKPYRLPEHSWSQSTDNCIFWAVDQYMILAELPWFIKMRSILYSVAMTNITIDSSWLTAPCLRSQSSKVMAGAGSLLPRGVIFTPDCMEVFMDDFTVYADSFEACLSNLSRVLKRCIDTNLVLNFEKCHFMVTEGIVLGHLVSNRGIEVDKAKIDVITSLPNPASVREVRSFLGHASFYRRFIKNFSKLALPLSKLTSAS
ncbi:Retrovirus-related Pol polyprotein from transposon opus, partial [Mucuna pruriens]